MDKILIIIKAFATAVISFTTIILGGSDTVLKVLLSFMILDYITGIIAAVYNKELNSQTGFKGLLKKITILCVVAVSHLAGTVTGANSIRCIVISFYIANEGISILENASRCDVKVLNKLKGILEQLNKE